MDYRRRITFFFSNFSFDFKEINSKDGKGECFHMREVGH